MAEVETSSIQPLCLKEGVYDLGEDCTSESRLLLGYCLFQLLKDPTNKTPIYLSSEDPVVQVWELIYDQTLQQKHVKKMAKNWICRWDADKATSWPIFSELVIERNGDLMDYTSTFDDRVWSLLKDLPIEDTLDEVMRWPSGLALHFFKTLSSSSSIPDGFEDFRKVFGFEHCVFKTRTKPRLCPLCRQNKVLEIMYGMPTYEMFQAAEKGEVVLGGCCIEDSSPNWRCPTCGLNLGRVSTTQDDFGIFCAHLEKLLHK